MTDMKDIKYTLRGVSIDQFATPFEPASNDFVVNINIPIKTNYQEQIGRASCRERVSLCV